MSSVVFRKIGGFYNIFDDDAIIISYLCNYKIVNGRCGFPINSIDKVINILENNKINYIIKDGIEEVSVKNYKKNNKYNSILEKGKKKNNIDYRINSIINKIKELDSDNLCELLNVIEDNIYE